MNYRIKKYEQGYVVEVEKGIMLKRWVCLIKSAGLDVPWFHSSYQFALDSLIQYVSENAIKNSE